MRRLLVLVIALWRELRRESRAPEWWRLTAAVDEDPDVLLAVTDLLNLETPETGLQVTRIPLVERWAEGRHKP